MSTHLKKLYKSKHSRMVSGVFGGLGEWMEVNPNILRVGYIILAIVTSLGSAILVYILAHFFISSNKGPKNTQPSLLSTTFDDQKLSDAEEISPQTTTSDDQKLSDAEELSLPITTPNHKRKKTKKRRKH